MVSPRLSSDSANPNPNPNSSPNQETESLRSYLLNCSDQDTVSACRAIETFLLHQPPEATLGFFRLCFPVLIQRIFGFRDSPSSESTAWIVRASGDHDAIMAIQSLLHPTAPLFSSLLAIDRENLVRFLFPNERLPLRTRRCLLVNDGHRILSDTSLLFKNYISNNGVLYNQNVSASFQLQLNLFEYFMFWFAYYGESSSSPIREGLVSQSDICPRPRSSPKRLFGQWVSHPFHHQHGGDVNGPKCNLYLHLLQLYLLHFVQPHHLAGSIYTQDSSELSQGGFLLLTLIEFWLMKDDLWPLNASQVGSITFDYTPPGSKLCEALRLLVNHCNSLLKASLEQYHHSLSYEVTMPSRHWMVATTTPLLLPRKIGIEGDSTTLEMRLLQKPLYRFISCAFTKWPSGIPIKQARYLVNVWVDYIQPWNIELEENEIEITNKSLEKRSKGYLIIWQDFVTQNYPFYTTLVARFLELALKSVHANLEAVLDMTVKVLGVLAGSKGLLEHLKKLELSYGSPAMRLDGSSGEMDWEQRYSASDMGLYGSGVSHTTQEKLLPHLFGSGSDSAFQTFQILILQAEMEMQYAPVEKHKDIMKALERLKQAGGKVFDFHASSTIMPFHPQPQVPSQIETETRSLGRHTCFDVKYRGDWMRRPIESTEIAWLARILVKLSDFINYRLGFNAVSLSEPCDEHEEALLQEERPNLSTQMDALSTEVRDVDVPKLIKTSTYFASEMKDFLSRCWVFLVVYMRRHGWRVNLRVLARKPLVVMFLLLLFCWIVKRQ